MTLPMDGIVDERVHRFAKLSIPKGLGNTVLSARAFYTHLTSSSPVSGRVAQRFSEPQMVRLLEKDPLGYGYNAMGWMMERLSADLDKEEIRLGRT